MAVVILHVGVRLNAFVVDSDTLAKTYLSREYCMIVVVANPADTHIH
jgi:hypothetical protein